MSFNQSTNNNSGAKKFANKNLNTAGNNIALKGSTSKQNPGGMAVLRDNTKVTKAVGAAAAPIASVAPMPLNTPSNRKEHNGRDPTISLVSGNGSNVWGNSESSSTKEAISEADLTKQLGPTPAAAVGMAKPAPWAKSTTSTTATTNEEGGNSEVRSSTVETTPGSSMLLNTGGSASAMHNQKSWADFDSDDDDGSDNGNAAPSASNEPRQALGGYRGNGNREKERDHARRDNDYYGGDQRRRSGSFGNRDGYVHSQGWRDNNFNSRENNYHGHHHGGRGGGGNWHNDGGRGGDYRNKNRSGRGVSSGQPGSNIAATARNAPYRPSPPLIGSGNFFGSTGYSSSYTPLSGTNIGEKDRERNQSEERDSSEGQSSGMEWRNRQQSRADSRFQPYPSDSRLLGMGNGRGYGISNDTHYQSNASRHSGEERSTVPLSEEDIAIEKARRELEFLQLQKERRLQSNPPHSVGGSDGYVQQSRFASEADQQSNWRGVSRMSRGPGSYGDAYRNDQRPRSYSKDYNDYPRDETTHQRERFRNDRYQQYKDRENMQDLPVPPSSGRDGSKEAPSVDPSKSFASLLGGSTTTDSAGNKDEAGFLDKSSFPPPGPEAVSLSIDQQPILQRQMQHLLQRQHMQEQFDRSQKLGSTTMSGQNHSKRKMLFDPKSNQMVESTGSGQSAGHKSDKATNDRSNHSNHDNNNDHGKLVKRSVLPRKNDDQGESNTDTRRDRNDKSSNGSNEHRSNRRRATTGDKDLADDSNSVDSHGNIDHKKDYEAKRKELRDKERANRGPRTKGFLFYYSETGRIERLFETEEEKENFELRRNMKIKHLKSEATKGGTRGQYARMKLIQLEEDIKRSENSKNKDNNHGKRSIEKRNLPKQSTEWISKKDNVRKNNNNDQNTLKADGTEKRHGITSNDGFTSPDQVELGKFGDDTNDLDIQRVAAEADNHSMQHKAKAFVPGVGLTSSDVLNIRQPQQNPNAQLDSSLSSGGAVANDFDGLMAPSLHFDSNGHAWDPNNNCNEESSRNRNDSRNRGKYSHKMGNSNRKNDQSRSSKNEDSSTDGRWKRRKQDDKSNDKATDSNNEITGSESTQRDNRKQRQPSSNRSGRKGRAMRGPPSKGTVAVTVTDK